MYLNSLQRLTQLFTPSFFKHHQNTTFTCFAHINANSSFYSAELSSYPDLSMLKFSNSLEVSWLRLHAVTADSTGPIIGQGTKILHAMWHGQIKKEKKKKILFTQPTNTLLPNFCIFPKVVYSSSFQVKRRQACFLTFLTIHVKLTSKSCLFYLRVNLQPHHFFLSPHLLVTGASYLTLTVLFLTSFCLFSTKHSEKSFKCIKQIVSRGTGIMAQKFSEFCCY